jgi:diaminopimelate decarboxylase
LPISEGFAERLEPLLEELVTVYGTPFHIYDARGIVATYRAMAAAFEAEPYRQYFAVKALPNPHVLSLLLREGSGLDCASPVELELARSIGAEPGDVVFTSNNTAVSEYQLALKTAALITLDDRSFLEKADPLPDVVCFRASPHGLASGSSLMGDAEASKFGVPVDELADAYREAGRRGATRFGIHGMTCANELDVNRAARAAVDVLELGAQVAESTGIEFEYVNVGGGLGIPYRPGEQAIDFTVYADAIVEARRRCFPRSRPRILMECGRFVTGPHGVLVTRVINDCRKGRRIIGVDASMSALMRPGFYGAYHHVRLPFAAGRPEARFDVVGALCENIDKFAVDRLLPEPREGDIAVIHDTGAHGHAMGFTYNGRLRPAELLLTEDGAVVEIRRAESFEDYLATTSPLPVPVLAAGSGASAVRRAEAG